MNMTHNQRCQICGEPMRRVHTSDHGSWCWNCEPYRPGAAIRPAIRPNKIQKVLNRAPLEFLKALMFIFLGYGWAAAAYGVFPG